MKTLTLSISLITCLVMHAQYQNKVIKYNKAILLSSSNAYHVSTNGNDSNDGSASAPFKTISKAATLAMSGDTVYIHGGVYEETLSPTNSGTSTAPIVFQAYKNEKVVITAMQALTNWSLDEGKVYKTMVDWDLGQENFVMNGTTACDLARWPNNTDGDPFTLNSKRNDGGSGEDVATNAYLTHSEIPNFDWSKGGSVFFYGDRPGSGWLAWKAYIKSSSAGEITFDLDKNSSWIRTAHPPSDKGDYYLEGIKEAIDYDNEWYFDGTTKTLYIQIPGGKKPADSTIMMRKRLKTVDLNDKDYIEIRNIAVFGGSIEIGGNNNKIYAISSFYGNYTRGIMDWATTTSRSIYIKQGANNNIISKCEVAFGSGTGIWDNGNNSVIENCHIHDFNFLGCYDAPVMARGGTGSIIKNNTIHRAGRDALQIINTNSEVAYNDLSNSNLIADDCALLYTIGAGLFMEIHHNWFHDNFSRGDLQKAAGIYLDNDASEVKVYNNVVYNTEWSSIQINWNGTNIDVFNNTLWDGSAAMGAWHKEGTSFSNVRVWNNLTNMNSLEPQSDKQNNLILDKNANPFDDIENMSFSLKNGEEAIDYGKIISGYTDGYKGAAPDAGAYESGNNKWVAGINWNPTHGPTENGPYGLPGEESILDSDSDGIPDYKDDCPETPAMATVNSSGCEESSTKFEYELIEHTIYPNPVTGCCIFVSSSGLNMQSVEWKLFSCNGDILGEGILPENENRINIPSSLKQGIYFIQLSTLNNTTSKKVLIQR